MYKYADMGSFLSLSGIRHKYVDRGYHYVYFLSQSLLSPLLSLSGIMHKLTYVGMDFQH